MHTDTDAVLYFQEASSELEVVNVDGRTADALTVRTCVHILIYIASFYRALLRLSVCA